MMNCPWLIEKSFEISDLYLIRDMVNIMKLVVDTYQLYPHSQGFLDPIVL